MLGGIVSGDVKPKSLLVYHSENPHDPKGCIKAQLPVVWCSNPNSWVTQAVMQDYVVSYFSPFMERYYQQNNPGNKALLLVDNAPGHPQHMEDWCENVNFEFLPPNTTKVLQPMDQGVVAVFNAYYIRCTMRQLLNETDGEGKLSICDFWKTYNIKKDLENKKLSWDEVDDSAMNGLWLALWAECVNDFSGFGDNTPAQVATNNLDVLRSDIVVSR